MKYYNRTNTCERIKKDGNLCGNEFYCKAHREKDKDGNWTGKWTCKHCYEIYYKYKSYEKPEKKYNETNTCDRCKDTNIETKLVSGKAYREKDKDGNKTGRWLCINCYMIPYRKEYEKNSPNSYTNAIKPIANHRTGNLNPNCSQAKGDYFEEITSASRRLKILSIENDCYNGPLDHSRDPELGILETRGKIYNPFNRNWRFGGLENLHNKEFDFLIAYCADKNMNIIIALLFPKNEVKTRSGIFISKNPVRGTWYDKYIINFDLWTKGVIKYVY